MKFYIATRYSVSQYREQAILIKEQLEAAGHTMTYDWMSEPNIKPYLEHKAATTRVAEAALKAATECDFFILLPEMGGTGMYVEFGAKKMPQRFLHLVPTKKN